jgi:hypothetical protein
VIDKFLDVNGKPIKPGDKVRSVVNHDLVGKAIELRWNAHESWGAPYPDGNERVYCEFPDRIEGHWNHRTQSYMRYALYKTYPPNKLEVINDSDNA